MMLIAESDNALARNRGWQHKPSELLTLLDVFRTLKLFSRCFLELNIFNNHQKFISDANDLTKDRKLGMSLCSVVMYGVQLMSNKW